MSWLRKRLVERTSLDGLVLISTGAAVLLAGPFVKIAAYVAICYGLWTIIKKEK